LALHMYAQDWDEGFPVLADGDMAFVELNLLVPKYIGTGAAFFCPSAVKMGDSKCAVSGINPVIGEVSYAYAHGLSEHDPSDSVIVADQSGETATTKDEVWNIELDGDGGTTSFVNHDTDGVNALYIDGHVSWIPLDKIAKEDSFVGSGTGLVRNPGETRIP